jgi:REP element-mobilizing transposase RayT
MAHTYSKLLLHAVFSTKERRPFIQEAWHDRLYKYIFGIAEELDAHLIRAGGVADHVHLVLQVRPAHAPADLIRVIKANSSKWVHETFPDQQHFAWQSGYSVFTVSSSQLETVVAYADNQAEHHRQRTFKEELLGLLAPHGIEYDERYLWD